MNEEAKKMKIRTAKAALVMVLVSIVFFVSNGKLYAELEYGLKGGFSFSKMNMSGPDIDPYTSKNLKGIHAGLFFNYPVLDNYAVETGAYYVSKGVTREWNPGGAITTDEVKVEYIEVPLFLKYSFAPSTPFSPYILGGGYGAYCIGAKNKYDGENIDIKRYFKKLDWGLTFGVGFDFKLMGSVKIGIEGRYSFSLSDVHDIQPESLEDYQMKNRTFSLLLGIHF
jgi:outer membrane protein W